MGNILVGEVEPPSRCNVRAGGVLAAPSLGWSFRSLSRSFGANRRLHNFRDLWRPHHWYVGNTAGWARDRLGDCLGAGTQDGAATVDEIRNGLRQVAVEIRRVSGRFVGVPPVARLDTTGNLLVAGVLASTFG